MTLTAEATSPRAGRVAGNGVRTFTKDQWLILAAITALAALLRFYRLGEWAFWIDEAHTFRDIVKPAEEFWSSRVSAYPLSYLVLRALSGWLPAEEGWLRMPFAIAGILSVPTLALVARGLVGRTSALIAALLLACSPWHIYWSQNARAYTLVLLFGMLAAGMFHSWVERRSPWRLLLALVITVLAGLNHPSAYLLLAAFLAYGLLLLRTPRNVQARSGKWLPLLIFVLLAVVTALLLPVLQYFMRAHRPDFSLLHLASTLVFFVRVPLLVGAIGGMLLLFDRGEGAAPFLTSWALVPLLTLGVLATGILKVTAQYAIYTLPAFCILGAVTVTALAHLVGNDRGFRGRLLRIVPLGILLLDMVGQDYIYFQKHHGERPRWREAAHYVEQHAEKPARVLTTNGPSMRFYLDRGSFSGRAGDAFQIVPILDWELNDTDHGHDGEDYMRGKIERARRQGIDLFILLTEPELYEMDRKGRANAYIRTHLVQVRRFPNWTGPKDMTVLVYRSQHR